MAKHRLFAAALAAIVVAVPVAAQKGGTVEVGGFGQYTVADDAWHVQNGWGLGGRLGVFLASHWELEAAAAPARQRGGRRPDPPIFDHGAQRGHGRANRDLDPGESPFTETLA